MMVDDKKHKILIVDDDKVGSLMLQRLLGKAGYAVTVENSALRAVELLEASTFDILLLDVMMPEMSGLEFLKKVREKHSHFELPVIMVTAKSEGEDIATALESGANDYVTKPLDMAVVYARVKTNVLVRDLYFANLQNKQFEAINAMIVTYNHEINNPLAIATGSLYNYEKSGDKTMLQKTEDALMRIAEIVKKISKIESGEVEMESYSGSDSSLMVKVK